MRGDHWPAVQLRSCPFQLLKGRKEGREEKEDREGREEKEDREGEPLRSERNN
jgi:hypothetical protein